MSRGWARLGYLPYLINSAYLLASIGLLVLALRGYSQPAPVQAARAAGLALVVVGLLSLVAVGGPRLNGVVCLAISTLLVWGQWRLKAHRVEDYPAGPTRRPAPYVMFSGAPGARDHNRLGYRGPLPVEAKPPGEYRVLVVGGSAVYGSGPKELTIPHRLEQIARRSGRDQIQVHNWGVVSQVSGQELATIALRATRYAPDLVVLYSGGNDISAAYTYDPRPGYPFNFALHENAVRIFQEGDLSALLAGVLTQSTLLRRLFGAELSDAAARLPRLRRAVGFGSRRWEEAVAQEYLDHVEQGCRLGLGLSFKVAVVLQPLVFYSPQADSYGSLPPDFRPYAERQYQRIRRGFQALARRYAADPCLFADLSRACAGGECVFEDLIHPTPETRGPIAEALFRRLNQAGMLPPEG
jgi:hypothetical protein